MVRYGCGGSRNAEQRANSSRHVSPSAECPMRRSWLGWLGYETIECLLITINIIIKVNQPCTDYPQSAKLSS